MISVIIPSLNSAYIKRIVGLLDGERERFKDMEIIVVGKDDVGILRGEENIRFVDTGKAVPPATARNIGIKLAGGDVIIFLDSDCIPQEGYLTYLMSAHARGKEVVGGSIDFPEGNFWRLCDNIIHFYGSHPSRRGAVLRDGPLPTANLSVSKQALNKAGLFSENLITGEDFEYSMKLREKGFALNFERRAKVLHLPARASLLDIFKHSMAWAKNSVHIRKRFGRLLNTPFFMRNGMFLYLSSPLLACLSVFKVFSTSPGLLKYWHTVPVIYLAKLIWSITASQDLVNAGAKRSA